MEELFFQLDNISSYLAFFLLLLRIGGFLQTIPIFSSNSIPQTIKIFVSIILAVFFYKYYTLVSVDFSQYSAIDFLVLAFKEVLIGVLLGILPRIIFYAVIFAADLISNVIGYSFANIYNPQENQPSTTLGILLEILAVLIFISFGFHHFLIEYIFNSYQLIPPLSYSISGATILIGLQMINQIFIIGLVFSAPVITIAFVVNIGLGFANRTIIQLNVFIVGSLMVLLIGLVFLALTMPFFAESLRINWERLQPIFVEIFNSLSS